MNIFVLDLDLTRCARAHCDQHVSKMILESVQLLCTAAHSRGFPVPYRPTHVKHPCVYWVAESYSNFRWLTRLARALNREYRWRFGKTVDHASITVLPELADVRYADSGLTPFAQAMPDRYKVAGDAVHAYRNFYIGEKSGFARWTRRRPPTWFREAVVVNSTAIPAMRASR